MRQPIDFAELAVHKPLQGCVLTVGNFDGVHRGHKVLLDAAKARALHLGLPLVALTFEPHTRHFLDPAGGPLLLSTWCECEWLLSTHGVDLPITLRFDDSLRRLTAEEFVQRLVADLNVQELVLGFDHRFGRGAAGTAEGILPLCQSLGVPLSVVGAVQQGQAPISSTRIREALVSWGQFSEALDLLGHPWMLFGEVVRGHGRGRTIDFPTANLEPLNTRKLLPAPGVYAGRLHWGGHGHGCVVNIGFAPTFQRGSRVVEAHVLERFGPDYGQICHLDLYFSLRKESRFESLSALRAQIGSDAETARNMVLGLPETRGAPGFGV